MKRIQSNNPNRTEENKDLFDHVEGKFSLWAKHHFLIAFKYYGNNMQESVENRNHARKRAEDFAKVMRPFNPDIVIIEEDL